MNRKGRRGEDCSTFYQWIPFDSVVRLSQLREKFWNYSVEQEEDEWRRDHPDGTAMEVDGGDQDITNEIGPGCYPSNWMWSISGTQYSGYADYIRIYYYCEKFYNELKDDDGMAPSVFITGQPGIGECFSY